MINMEYSEETLKKLKGETIKTIYRIFEPGHEVLIVCESGKKFYLDCAHFPDDTLENFYAEETREELK